MTDSNLTIIGGGLAGSEAAWQAAQQGIHVMLYEMRPALSTGAHITSNLAELVCSNSLGSDLPDRASGLLKNELRKLGSILLDCAEKTALPAGGALAVDRDLFAQLVTQRLSAHKNIEIVREEMTVIPDGITVISSGPLTSERFSKALSALTGKEHLFFYDAIAPIVSANSINHEIAFRASRYGKGDNELGDYINCPLSKDEYDHFVDALLSAERIRLQSFEADIPNGVNAGASHFFEGCLPIEIIAQRGRDALAFGPMRPVGLLDPRQNKRPYAVVQLRQDDLAGSLYNLVGFQTNLTYPEQKRVLRLIPGLEQAEFIRYGQMHRNTFISSPTLLHPTLQLKIRPKIFFAGQITGAEGYMGNIATGLLAGQNAARLIHGLEPLSLPPTTMLGALCHYITHSSPADFQPMKANYGILPPLTNAPHKNKRERAMELSHRALADLDSFLKEI